METWCWRNVNCQLIWCCSTRHLSCRQAQKTEDLCCQQYSCHMFSDHTDHVMKEANTIVDNSLHWQRIQRTYLAINLCVPRDQAARSTLWSLQCSSSERPGLVTSSTALLLKCSNIINHIPASGESTDRSLLAVIVSLFYFIYFCYLLIQCENAMVYFNCQKARFRFAVKWILKIRRSIPHLSVSAAELLKKAQVASSCTVRTLLLSLRCNRYLGYSVYAWCARSV